MILCLFGESCTGKSSIAEYFMKNYDAIVYTGKDYIRLAKSEMEARNKFKSLLKEHESEKGIFIYVANDREQLELLPNRAIRVLLSADLSTILERFAKRMGCRELPPPIVSMLTRKHGTFDQEKYQLRIENQIDTIEVSCDKIMQLLQ